MQGDLDVWCYDGKNLAQGCQGKITKTQLVLSKITILKILIFNLFWFPDHENYREIA